MHKLLSLTLAAALAALPLVARANVIWTFYETSCTAPYGSCPMPVASPVTFPYPIATLILPNATSSGSAFWQEGPGLVPPPMYTGDPFTFSFPGRFGTISSSFTGGPGYSNSFDFHLIWSTTPTTISANIFFSTGSDVISLNGAGFAIFPLPPGPDVIGSDGSIGGCFFAQCPITGYWQSNLVPEPMSVSLLVSGLLGFAIARRFRRLGTFGT